VKFIKAGTPGVTCADVVTKTVLVNALPAITFTVASSVCKNGTPINISANPAGGVFKINGTTITQIDPALYPVGNVTVNYAITDNNTGCLNTSSTVVAIAPLPTYEWVDVLDNYCILDNNEVTPKLRITDTDGTIKIVTLAPFTPSFKGALGELNFNIGASVSGANSCNDIATKAIKINEPVDVQFVDLLDEYCQQALPVTLKANPSGGTFKVNGVATGSLVPMDFAVGDVVRVEYTYSTNGCLVVIEKEVDIVQGTAYTPTTENLIVCPPNAQGYPLEAVPLSQAQAGYKFEWTSTVPALNGQTTRVLYVKEDQTGKHKVLIRDAGNCPIDEITFDVLIKCNTAFFIPTAFTPNGDGKNDMLEIFGADFTKLRMQIYNRWGEVVFTARSKSEGWDGKIKGQPAPAGVYTWKASYESVLQPGTVIEKEGSINLIR
jgi:gliding motility-associated-like protein